MKLHNPIKVAVDTHNDLLGIFTVITVLSAVAAAIVLTMSYLGPTEGILVALGLASTRVLYAVFKGK